MLRFGKSDPGLVIDLEGPGLTDVEKHLLEHPRLKGVILFTRNAAEGRVADSLRDLTALIKSIRSDCVVMVDQEGGSVQRFRGPGFRWLPSARLFGEVAAWLDLESAKRLGYEYAALCARTLKAVGIDFQLGPVLDLHSGNPVIGGMDRAYSSNPDEVVALAEAVVGGFHSEGMPVVGKHFPGHGACLEDSHDERAVSHASWEQLMTEDLKPFATLIAREALDAVMPGHVHYMAVDPTEPAGFSPIWLQTVLRAQLNFKGLVISDCLSMKGSGSGDLVQKLEKAWTAGCDWVILCGQSRLALANHLNGAEALLAKRLG